MHVTIEKRLESSAIIYFAIPVPLSWFLNSMSHQLKRVKANLAWLTYITEEKRDKSMTQICRCYIGTKIADAVSTYQTLSMLFRRIKY